MSSSTLRIILAGGGTGGHLFPALAIADEIKRERPQSNILFVGTKGKIEARLVPERGYPLRTIWISGFHRKLSLSNILFPLKVAVAMMQSFFLIKHFRPHVVVGTGGYVSGLPLAVAALMRIPTVLHESNSYPGVTTRLLAQRMTKVLISFEETRRWLKRSDNVERVGTPLRASLGAADRTTAREFFGLESSQRTILVFGGSLGATSINSAVLAIVDSLRHGGIQLIWQTGPGDYQRVITTLGNRRVGWVGPFIDRMEYAYAASDLVVCRAGALTIAELTVAGKPAILVPYPHAAADHQTMNARTLVEAGAAVMVQDAELASSLPSLLMELLNDDSRRARMAQASKRLGNPDATREIVQEIVSLAK